MRRLEYFADDVQILLENVVGTDIDLGENDEEGYFQSESDAQMFLGHPGDSHIGPDGQHGVIGTHSDETVHGGFEILLVTAKVEKGDDLVTRLHHLAPVFVLVRLVPLGQNLNSLFIEAHDLLRDAARSAVLSLVRVVEHSQSSLSSSVVHYPFAHHSHQSCLPTVHVPHDRYLYHSHSHIFLLFNITYLF